MADPEDNPPPAEQFADDDSDVSDLDAESSVLAPVQRRIEKQLLESLEENKLEAKDSQNELNKFKQMREDIGVELYNLQQHLAKLQEQVERQDDQLATAQEARVTMERKRDELARMAGDEAKRVADLQARHQKYRAEYDLQTETLIRVEQFNDQIRGEIAVERRAAYVTEKQITEAEKAKGQQDVLIDSMVRQVVQLEEQLALYQAQIMEQENETGAARNMLTDVVNEMDMIRFDRKKLLSDWKAALVEMSQKDGAVDAAERELTKQEDLLQTLNSEIAGGHAAVAQEQDLNERLTGQYNRTAAEIQNVQRRISQQMERKETLQNRYTLLQTSLRNTDAEMQEVTKQLKALRGKVSSAEATIANITRETKDLDNKLFAVISDQITAKKGSSGGLKSVSKIKGVIADKELQIANLENELARIRVDSLETDSHILELTAIFQSHEQQLAEKDSLLAMTQQDIRRKHDEIERKQNILDSLNKQMEGILSAQGLTSSEGIGPLESTINSLSKSISQKSTENDELQRAWVRQQSELVNLKNKQVGLSDSISEMQAQAAVLSQKRNRIEAEVSETKRDVTEFNNELHRLHYEQSRLNTVLAENAKRQDKVADDGFQLEARVIQRLSERKMEALTLENKIESVRQEKADLLAEIVESERKVQFWTKKLSIAKETAEAIDPAAGREEITRMKNEIQIMTQRKSNLKRDMARRIQELERDVDHRETLKAKGQAAMASTSKGLTKAAVERDTARVLHALKKNRQQAQQREKQIEETRAATSQVAAESARISREAEELRNQVSELSHQLEMTTMEKQIVVNKKLRLQRAISRLRDSEKGQYRPVLREDRLEASRQNIVEKQTTVKQIANELTASIRQTQFPHYERQILAAMQNLQLDLG